jgi:hypothetical protein
MIVYIVTRAENGRTAVWDPFISREKAVAMINSHTAFRIKNGAVLQRTVPYTPMPVNAGTKVRVGGSESKPVQTSAPECITCVVHEVEIIAEDGKSRSIYRVTQHSTVE